MALSAFSPRKFYEAVTGAPFDPLQATITIPDIFPDRGLTVVRASPNGDNHDVWLRGCVAPSRQRSHFIQEIRQGEIPRPYQPSFSGVAPSNVRYISVPQLFNATRSVASILGLIEPLVEAACKSRSGRCPVCKGEVRLFHSPLELAHAIADDWEGEEIQLELSAPSATIRLWSETSGFSYHEAAPLISRARIDTLSCTRKGCERLVGLLLSTRHVEGSWIVVSSESNSREYAWSGRCSSCGVTSPPPQRSALRRALESGGLDESIHELDLTIADVSLREALYRPLSQLTISPFFADLLSAQQRDYIPTLHLGDVTLAHIARSLPIQALTAIALLSSLNKYCDSTAPLVFNAPTSHLSSASRARLSELASFLGETRGVVWLSDDHTPDNDALLEPVVCGGSTAVATLSLSIPDQHRIPISVGGCSHAPAKTSDGATRLSRHIVAAQSERADPHARWDFLSPVSTDFIPLFPTKVPNTRLVAHQLSIVQPIAKLFASSRQAKALGIEARDLALGELRRSHGICSSCGGSGVTFESEGVDLPVTAPCSSCWGIRFRAPLSEVTFGGKTFWQVLNSPLGSIKDTLRALPKMAVLIELIDELALSDIICGMPLSLLTPPEQRLLMIVGSILNASKARPRLVMLEEPFTGLSREQIVGLRRIFTLPSLSGRVGWLLISG